MKDYCSFFSRVYLIKSSTEARGSFNSHFKLLGISKLGIFGDQSKVDIANSLETGRIVAKDIGGSDPERMAAPR